jgi:hypothetical protein
LKSASAVALNKKIVASSGNNGIVLSERSCLPHISLAMGCMELSGIQGAKKKLLESTSKIKPIVLEPSGFENQLSPSGEKILHLVFKENRFLRGLQSSAMKTLIEFLSFCARKDFFLVGKRSSTRPRSTGSTGMKRNFTTLPCFTRT